MKKEKTAKSTNIALPRRGDKLLTVMRYEWRILKADHIAQTVVSLFLVIVGCALLNGFAAHGRQKQKVDEGGLEQQALYDKTRGEIERAEQERLAKGESLNLLRSGIPSPSAGYSKLTNFKATLPPGSLGMLNVGQSDLHPQTFAYKTGARFSPFYPTTGTQVLSGFFPERSTDNPLLMMLGQFDLAFVLLYIYPLIILVLAFNIMTGDREAGILALALSQPIRFRTLLLGKVAVRFLLVFTVGVMLPLLISLVFTTFLNSGSEPGKMIYLSGLWALTAILYGCFWFVLALFINAIGRSVAANAVVSVVGWIAFVILIPALVNLTIQVSLPSLSNFEFVTKEREASLEINPQIDAVNSFLNQYLRERYPTRPGDNTSQERYNKAYFGDPVPFPVGEELFEDFIKERPEWAQAKTPNQLSRALFEIRRTQMEKRLAPVLKRIDERRKQQETLIGFLSFASPTILAQSVLSDVAETGSERHEHFLGQLDQYIRERVSDR